MAAEVLAAWIAAAASLGSAAVSWLAKDGAARAAAAADRHAALVEAKTDVWTSDKAIYVERVTAERGVWRSEMRVATATVVAWLGTGGDADRTAVHAALSGIALRLNPLGRSSIAAERDSQPLDRDIFAVIADIRASLGEADARPGLADRLERAVGLLLKQEWTKSKDEARRSDVR